ncbi:acryloyl-CoA reductase [Thalassoglobus sp. JC818]|uniref:acrylyl-CoA reductase family protein n=1 Tax=Thalassoglobus sp. JC818 TaxID=3232136 RepID=UPI0034575BA5
MEERTTSCYLVNRTDESVQAAVTSTKIGPLQSGDVLLEVSLSSLNYKDAMAATGHPGIVKNFPHVPGIDSVGTVVESQDDRFKAGDVVIATGHELGVERWGGWSENLICPGDWLVPLPDGMTPEESMILGTAGFTAAQCVSAILDHKILPEQGPVVVTGATGGVGSLSVALLAKLGFHVHAVTGKTEKHDWLKSLGAKEISGRELLSAEKRPLLKGEFAAGVDTVGGDTLATLIKKTHHRGCVACCGVTGGAELPLTVYPFILRGVTLAGIDSAWCPDDQRAEIWKKLASDWKLDDLDQLKVPLTFDDLPNAVDEILAGKFSGRGVVQIAK